MPSATPLKVTLDGEETTGIEERSLKQESGIIFFLRILCFHF